MSSYVLSIYCQRVEVDDSTRELLVHTKHLEQESRPGGEASEQAVGETVRDESWSS